MSGWIQDSVRPEHVILVNTDKVSVVRVATVNKRMPGWQRRAPIIAAAPALLAACKAIVQAGSDTAEVVKQAERAIAAAEPKP